jgi:hypothetical protein
MKDGRASAIGLILVLLPIAGPAGVSAQMFVSTGRDTLRGLPGVEVAVESVPPELQRAGLTTPLLRADVEQRLRAGGVTIYATQQENPSRAKPYVYLHLNALDLPGGLQAVGVQLHLRQTLRSPVTDSNIVNAMTWDAHNVVGLTGTDVRLLREAILGMVDDFITDWRAVH